MPRYLNSGGIRESSSETLVDPPPTLFRNLRVLTVASSGIVILLSTEVLPSIVQLPIVLF